MDLIGSFFARKIKIEAGLDIEYHRRQETTVMTQKSSTFLAAILAATLAPASAAPGGDRSITIYNQNFAVVREAVPMTLTSGVNHVAFNDITYHVEPDSVVLRDPDPGHTLKVLEQNYRADPVSQDLLLSLYEGKTLEFQVQKGDRTEIVVGKLIRSGYVPHMSSIYDGEYRSRQIGLAYGGAGQPLVEVNGKLQFSLPGMPLFPALTDDSVLKPTLEWSLVSDRTGPASAELAYVTGGLNWEASYNVQAQNGTDKVNVTGWVTVDNESGKTFENAKVKLMAGDVRKLDNDGRQAYAQFAARAVYADSAQQSVAAKAFDDYHLYTLAQPVTLRDREVKQVEFLRAEGVLAKTVYVYDGLSFDDARNYGQQYQGYIDDPSYGSSLNKKVWVEREIVNSEANHLGESIPKGKVRFYRTDDDGQLEFTGEDTVDHTPKNETMRFVTGCASDLTGDRKQISYKRSNSGSTNVSDESFVITLHNHKAAPVDIRVVEHLYRGMNWTITDHSHTFLKKDSRTIEYNVTVEPEVEQKITYTVHYTW
jgi:hypothetical protein